MEKKNYLPSTKRTANASPRKAGTKRRPPSGQAIGSSGLVGKTPREKTTPRYWLLEKAHEGGVDLESPENFSRSSGLTQVGRVNRPKKSMSNRKEKSAWVSPEDDWIREKVSQHRNAWAAWDLQEIHRKESTFVKNRVRTREGVHGWGSL